MPQLPKPFSRPSISLPDPEEKREWRVLPISSVSPGDIVRNYGKVEKVVSDAGVTVVQWLNGTSTGFDSGEAFHVFSRVHI